MRVKALTGDEKKSLKKRERLRERYRPKRVEILFVGEAPPASGRFFYQEDSGLYRATRDAFLKVLPKLREREFLETFRKLECYLVDLCEMPVDRSERKKRVRTCQAGERRLRKVLQQLRPKIVVTLLKSIEGNVERALAEMKWSGLHVVLPYPGRWHRHRAEFTRRLVPILRKTVSGKSSAKELTLKTENPPR
jgi:hypothetical protein